MSTLYIYIYISVYVYIYIYIHTYIHTHIITYTYYCIFQEIAFYIDDLGEDKESPHAIDVEELDEKDREANAVFMYGFYYRFNHLRSIIHNTSSYRVFGTCICLFVSSDLMICRLLK